MGFLNLILMIWHWLVSVAGTIAVACVILAFILFLVELAIYKRKKRRNQS
ncbi:MAG: hypothetical protein LUC41_02575 [Clostridiales bacterium]|nr:hypothetical protein [Clostridiales bacterium]